MSEREYYVYLHKNPENGEVFYVGKGTRNRAWNFRQRNVYWKRVFEKHGVIVDICCENMSEQDAFLLEMWLIAKYRHYGVRLTNMTDGGDGVSGVVFSKSEIERRRLFATGRAFSNEAKSKLSALRKGRPREFIRGGNHPCYDGTVYTFVNGETVFIGSSYVLSEITGHDNKEIRKIARGSRITYKGWSVSN